MHGLSLRRGLRMALAGLCLAGAGAGVARAETDTSDLVSQDYFRVGADPANTPFSNQEETGFENRIAALFAEKLGRRKMLMGVTALIAVSYHTTWLFARDTVRRLSSWPT